jgi:preprotein translocase subunit SecB
MSRRKVKPPPPAKTPSPIGGLPVTGEALERLQELLKESMVVQSAPMTLQAVILRKLEFHEVPHSSPPVPTRPDQNIDIELNISGKFSIRPAGFEIYFELSAIPDPKYQPVAITAGVSTFVRAARPVSTMDELRAVRVIGSRVAVPFLREVIASTTQRSAFGTVLLNLFSVDFAAGTAGKTG